MSDRNEFEKYKRILRADPMLYKAVEGISGSASSQSNLARYVIAPVLVLYTRWILKEAQKRDIHRLYFLARDGWLMYHIAGQICKAEKLNLECSYFYCSRYALRAGAYRFFDDSAYEKLFLHSYRQNAHDMLCRAGLDETDREQIYDDIGYDAGKEYSIMGRKEFDEFCEKIKKSTVFRELLSRISEEAYPVTMRYIGQEGMNKHKRIGIVDLGWTGSLQYTLRKLLDSSHINTHITGFYMGMLDAPPKVPGSVYVPWLFDQADIKTKSWFAHNLMECICSAPHGMTLGYKNEEGHTVPIYAKQENHSGYIEEIKRTSLELSGKLIGHDPDSTDKTGYRDKKLAVKLLKQLMYSPTYADIAVLQDYSFCDDVGEQYHRSLVQPGTGKEFRAEILPFKLKQRDKTDGFFWYCGSLKISKLHFKQIYKTGYRLTRKLIERRKLKICHSEP
ncbi:MAG: hypothetical protein IK007_06950 [Lachnospiraceae bacterium]|nr:hypothetical protein [Lachnospiraceae bacterium]